MANAVLRQTVAPRDSICVELCVCRRFPAVPALFDDSDVPAMCKKGVEESNESVPLHEATRGRFYARWCKASLWLRFLSQFKANTHAAYKGTPRAIHATVRGISNLSSAVSGSVSN